MALSTNISISKVKDTGKAAYMNAAYAKGVVSSNMAGFYYVLGENGQLYECKLRGKLKTRILSGDFVEFTILGETQGIIERLLPRKNELVRPRIANVSLALIVLACSEPEPDLLLLDRLLASAAYAKVKPVILLNKVDLEPSHKVDLIREYYPKAGFNTILISTLTGEGMPAVEQVVQGEIAVMSAPSGVGKTSIIKALTDNEHLPTQTISKKLKRGRHTTRHVELYAVGESGFIADTPGFSAVDTPPVKKYDLRELFVEFKALQQQCKFNDCLHVKEPDCQVIAAVQNHEILASRYESYLQMLTEVIAQERW